ncbi:MAG: glycosyltransferase family 39 protein [candidate division WOR-3 bacterium]
MRKNLLIFPILIISLILNLYGIKWGLPDKEHPHPSFHPDETESVKSSLAILDPNRLLYPSPTALGNGSMQFYLVAIIYKLGSIFGFLTSTPTTYFELRDFYLAGRLLTVIMSAIMIYLVFQISKIIFGTPTALLAALFLTSAPGLVVSSHYFRSEVPAAFWIVLAFFFAVKIVQTKKTKYYFLCALAIGFATSTKYNSIFSILFLLAAHIMALKKKKVSVKTYIFNKKLIISLMIIVGTFFIGSIGSLIYFTEFKQRLIKQLEYQKGVFEPAAGLGPSWFGYFLYVLPYSMSLPLLLLSVFSFLFAWIKRLRWDILFIVWIIAYYILMSSSTWWVVRYTIPLLPPLAILSARLISNFSKRQSLRYLFLIIGLLIAMTSLSYSLILDSIMAAKDPRIAAYDWIDENIVAGSRIGIDLNPAAFYIPADEKKYNVTIMNIAENKLREIDYYIANDQFYQQYLRAPNLFPVENRYFNRILFSQEFKKVAKFENAIQLFGIKLPKACRGYTPADYFYFLPTITILKRVEVDSLR